MRNQANKVIKLLIKQGIKNEDLESMTIDLYVETGFHRWTINTTPENPDLFSNIKKIFKYMGPTGEKIVKVKYVDEKHHVLEAFGPWIRIYCKSYEKRVKKENKQ